MSCDYPVFYCSCLLYVFLYFFFLLIRPPPSSTLFPYTTLFRSLSIHNHPGDLAVSRVLFIPFQKYGDAHGEMLVSAMGGNRSEEHTSELQSHSDLVCRLLLEKKKKKKKKRNNQDIQKYK